MTISFIMKSDLKSEKVEIELASFLDNFNN